MCEQFFSFIPDKLQNEAMALHDEKLKTEASRHVLTEVFFYFTRMIALLLRAWLAY